MVSGRLRPPDGREGLRLNNKCQVPSARCQVLFVQHSALSTQLSRQTRRFLGGRQPLCGIGVTSRIERMFSPAAASAWIALSRPEPGPCTRTCTRFIPSCSASRAACSAATVAANGVLFLLPLKPALPALPHTTPLPPMSEMVTIVLLNVA